MIRPSNSRKGLILLVVLGMLALFSLLTVTYVVFASQSRSASIALSRRYSFQSTSTENPSFLFDEAIKQLIRGTKDPSSDMYSASLLEDFYGANETANLPQLSTIRPTMISGATLTHAWNNLERPMLIGNRFLRIPVVPGPLFPQDSDVLNGRILTFPSGQGPLGGLSFHIVRYIGDQGSNIAGCNYTVVIDLQENDMTRVHSQIVGTGGGNQTSMTGTLADWAVRYPAVTGSGSWAAGVYLCYKTVGLNPNLPLVLTDPYQFVVNAMPLNGHGMGTLADGSNQYHVLDATAINNPSLDPAINVVPAGLQIRAKDLGNSTVANINRLIDPDLNETAFVGPRQIQYGDTDEPIDAPDWMTPFLAFRTATAQSSGDIIPSFHRTALINYLVNFKDPTTYTELEFWAVLRRIELATMRPLSMTIRTPSGVPAFMDQSKVVAGAYMSHPDFNPTGSVGIVTLDINISGSWAGSWNSPLGFGRFKNWLDRLMVGRWDVDNLASGIPDSLFMDIGIPLQEVVVGGNSKMLKTLVAYYVECMDGKLDVNAAGGSAQANMYGSNLFTSPTATAPTSYTAPSAFARGNLDASGNSVYLNQGLGYGSGDISLRHLFGKSGLAWDFNGTGTFTGGQDSAEVAYRYLMSQRYSSTATPPYVGTAGQDALSLMNLVGTRSIHYHGGLPGLPIAGRGMTSIALDRLGNPFMHNEFLPINMTENEYEARLISSSFQDAPVTLADWERIYRLGDADRIGTPDRLQSVMGETDISVLTSSLRHEITARSRVARVPKFAARNGVYKGSDAVALDGSSVIPPPTSFIELIRTILQLKGLPQSSTLTYQNYLDLFPLEFSRGAAMNLNRMLGNGADDNNDGQVDEPLELTSAANGADDNSNSQIDEPAELWMSQVPYDMATLVSIGQINAVGMTYFGDRTFIGERNTNQFDPDVNAAGTKPNVRYLGEETRQLFARHLYCLAQLLLPQDYVFPNVDRGYWKDILVQKHGGNATATAIYYETRSRILAQWAVNVVDYRDADVVMTRFPYDPDPLCLSGSGSIGWNPKRTISGNSSTRIVWGMEQPELLLTESMAFHDLRVRKDPTSSNPRIDQFRTPQGSLFFELYCPRATGSTANGGRASTRFPGVSSLYLTPPVGDVALNLGKTTPSSVPGLGSSLTQYPVWRVYVSDSVDKTAIAATNKTPNERLTAAFAVDRNAPIRNDLSLQLPKSNWAGGTQPTAGTVSNGLAFDRNSINPTNTLVEPDPTTSRVILFTTGNPTTANVPGVTDNSQIFYNRSGSLSLQGNQYLVIGPRPTTYLGSSPSSKTKDSGKPDNEPSKQYIDFSSGNWASTTDKDGNAYRSVAVPNYTTNVKQAVTMVAAADAPSTWTSTASVPLTSEIGINISEPLPKVSGYYQKPTARINSTSSSSNGFPTINADGYHDFATGGNWTSGKAPEDDGTKGPLRNWDKNVDGAGSPLQIAQVPDGNNSNNNIVKPGTAIDWSTAYLQRLADPDKPWHPSFNPYLTVDWISIDLTVFSGEERDSEVGGTPAEMRLASRQKAGQMINSESQQFDSASNNTAGGQSFYSPLTHAPGITNRATTAIATSFLQYEIPGDKYDSMNNKWSIRPSTCDNKFASYNSGAVSPQIGGFTTLGFLNSPFLLAAESQIPNIPGTANITGNSATTDLTYLGAPADPTKTSATWAPSSVFWANRQFINSFELAYVPLSSPGQFGQEFSATSDNARSVFAPQFNKPNSSQFNYPTDPRMPTSVFSQQSSAITQISVEPHWQSNPQGTFVGTDNVAAYYPFMHLLNFFQEPTEIDRSEQKYRSTSGSVNYGGTYALEQYKHRHPKDSSLALLFDMLDTPSAWADVENFEDSSTFQYRDPSSLAQEFAVLADASNTVFAPFRAPYNKLPRDVEPGRVNINTLSEPNVLQGIWSNTLKPSDIDFAPYQPGQSFGQANDIDYNFNDVLEGGQRANPNSIGTIFDLFSRSRQGYDPVSGFYNPPSPGFSSTNPIRNFNPLFPTHFAGVFKPASEAGMVPQTCGRAVPTMTASTRNPIALPTLPLTNASDAQQLSEHLYADQYGMLDYYTRTNPVQSTLLRAIPNAANGMGTHVPSSKTLFSDSTSTQRHPFTDLYPISRLQKLVTERSCVFAVYTTLALFEYDQATGNIGKEFGSDTGESKRFKAFYVIDRSVPVGFRIGEDLNVENTILVRRLLAE